MGKQKYYSINNRVKRLYLFTLRPYTIPVLVLVVFLTGITLFNSSLTRKHALAASYTWDGGGSTNDWSECTNWSTDICPTSADSVTFNATSTKDSTVDASFGGTVTSLIIASGYTGTVSLGRSLTISATFSQAAGGFVSSNNLLDVDGSFVLSAGTFTAPSATMNVGNTFTISGGTFNHNGGTLTFDGSSSATLSCNSVTFNLVTFTHTGNVAKTVGSGCTLPLGNNPTVGGDSLADVTLNPGTLTGTGTLTIGNPAGSASNILTMNASSTLSGFTGLVTGSLTIAGATANFGSYTTMDVNATFSMTSGSFTAPSGTMTAQGFSVTSGTFSANSGTITFDGGTSSITCTGVTFNSVAINSTGNKTINSSCNLPLGNNPTITGVNILLNGTLSGTGTLSVAGSMTMNATTAVLSGFSSIAVSSTLTVQNSTDLNLTGYSPVTLNALVLASNAGTVTLPSGADINGGLTILGGTFNAPSGTMTVAGALTISGTPTFNANGGTVTFDGTANVTLSCNNATFNLVTFAHTAGTKTVSSNCTMPLGANPDFSNSAGLSLSGVLSGSGTLKLSRVSGFTINLNSGSSLTGFTGFVARNLNTATNLDFGSYSPVTLDSNFILLSGGNFTAPSGSMTVGGTFTISSGSTFNANGGTVTFDTTISAVITCSSAIFNLVTFAHTSGIKTVNTDCNLPLGSSPTVSSGITLSGALSGSGTLTVTTNILTLNSGYALTGFSGLVSGGPLNIIGATADFGNYTTFDVNDNFTLSSSAIFTAPSGTATFAGNFSLESGTTFNHNNGTVNFDGGTSAVFACNGIALNQVTFSHTAGTKYVSPGCSLHLGANPTVGNGGSLNLNGTLSGSGLLNVNGNLTLGSAGHFSGFSSLSATNLSVDGARAAFAAATMSAPEQLNAWQSASSLPAARYGTSATTYNGYAYMFGGLGTSNTNQSAVYYAAMNPDGSLGSWQTTTSLPIVRSRSAAVAYNGYVYVIGGSSTIGGVAGDTAEVTYAAINPDGSLGAWQTGTSLPSAQSFVSGVTVNGRVYIVVGRNGINEVYYATFNSDGSLGSWQTTSALPAARQGASAITANGYIYVFGGTTGSAAGGVDSAVYYAAVNPDGSLGSWQTGTSLPSIRSYTSAVTSGGYVYVFGGASISTAAGTMNDVAYAAIHSDGTLGAWQTGTSLPTIRQATSAVTHNGHVYVIGGTISSGASTIATVSYARLGTTQTHAALDSVNLSGNLLVDGSGQLTAPAGILEVGGNFTVTNGSYFHHNNGTLILDGSNQSIVGGITFYNLTKTITSADTLTFPAAATTAIHGDLTLRGIPGQLLSLVSSVPGTRWQLNVVGNAYLAYLHITDSHNTGDTLKACDSASGGNNLNWLIGRGNCLQGSSSTTTDTTTTSDINNDLTPDSQDPNSFAQALKKKTITETTGWSYKKILAYGIAGLVLLWILILLLIKLLKKREKGHY